MELLIIFLGEMKKIYIFISTVTDYGRQMKPFFIEIPNFWVWTDGRYILGDLGFISTYFGTVSPLSLFSINQPLFLQETEPLYPNPKYSFGIGI